MDINRKMTSGKKKQGIALLIVVAALSLVLSGCVAGVGTPTYADPAYRTVRVSQGATAGDNGSNQTLDEYGLFYSTSRADVVAVDEAGGSGPNIFSTIIVRPGVQQIRVITGTTVTPSEVGTFVVDAKNLTPGGTYYYRFYSIGRDSTGVQWRTLFAVGSHKTADPTLKSILTSTGRISPTFSKLRYSYGNVISASKSSARITVAPTVYASKVQMKVGSGSWSTVRNKLVSVSKGASKIVYIKVTATNHTTVVNYSVKVTRKRS